MITINNINQIDENVCELVLFNLKDGTKFKHLFNTKNNIKNGNLAYYLFNELQATIMRFQDIYYLEIDNQPISLIINNMQFKNILNLILQDIYYDFYIKFKKEIDEKTLSFYFRNLSTNDIEYILINDIYHEDIERVISLRKLFNQNLSFEGAMKIILIMLENDKEVLYLTKDSYKVISQILKINKIEDCKKILEILKEDNCTNIEL